MGSNQNLKAYVRYDGSNRVVAGSLIFRRKKPKVGKWHEIAISECCEYVPTSTTTTTSSSTSSTSTTSTSTSTTSTTTTQAVLSESAIGSFNSEDACAGIGNNLTVYYSGSLGNGTALFTDAGLTVPYSPGASPSGNGIYLRIYFQAQDQLCTMSGNIIQSYGAC